MSKIKAAMKKKSFLIGFAVAALLASCSKPDNTYKGPDYVMFADTLQTIAIQDGETYHDIPVSATTACNYDRTYAVEIVDKGTNAVEGKHFDLQSNTVTIPAGQLATSVKVRGHFDQINDTDSLGFELRLIADNDKIWDMYGADTKVVLQKVCPFDLDRLVGEGKNYAKLTSTWFEDFMQQTSVILLRPQRSTDPKDPENTIVLPNFLYEGHDMKITLHNDDPLQPLVTWNECVLGSTGEAFQGTVWGDDKLRAMPVTSATDYYNMCQGYVLQYMTIYVAGIGTVGTYLNVIEWISEAEYRELARQLGVEVE